MLVWGAHVGRMCAMYGGCKQMCRRHTRLGVRSKAREETGSLSLSLNPCETGIERERERAGNSEIPRVQTEKKGGGGTGKFVLSAPRAKERKGQPSKREYV